jgi:hypothetical protein
MAMSNQSGVFPSWDLVRLEQCSSFVLPAGSAFIEDSIQ